MTNKMYKYTYEQLNKNGDPEIQINYSSAGEIGQMFFYNAHLDAMIEADVNAFEERWPNTFAALQKIVNNLLTEPVKEYNKYE